MANAWHTLASAQNAQKVIPRAITVGVIKKKGCCLDSRAMIAAFQAEANLAAWHKAAPFSRTVPVAGPRNPSRSQVAWTTVSSLDTSLPQQISTCI